MIRRERRSMNDSNLDDTIQLDEKKMHPSPSTTEKKKIFTDTVADSGSDLNVPVRNELTEAKTSPATDAEVAKRLLQRREHLQNMCRNMSEECDLRTPIYWRIYSFHNYSTAICTIAKVTPA